MKKTCLLCCFALTLVLLSGCRAAQKEVIPLTEENFEEYIILDVTLDNFETETKSGIWGTEYRGVARLTATARLRKDVELDNVTIKGKVETNGDLWYLNYYEFTLDLDKNGEAEDSQTIYSGEYTAFIRPEAPTITPANLNSIPLTEDEFIVSINEQGNSSEGIVVQVSGNILE